MRGSHKLAKKIERKKMSARDENRHLDVKREVNFRMSALIERYREEYGLRKRSSDRERSILNGIKGELGRLFVREVDGVAVGQWYQGLMTVKKLSAGTAVRHFNVMHHMMQKACTIWSKETGIDRNPADQVEVKRPDDQRDRYLSEIELPIFKQALDAKSYRKGMTCINRTFYRLRMLVLIALTTGMRQAEIFNLRWPDVIYTTGLIAVRSKLKGARCDMFQCLLNSPKSCAGFRSCWTMIGSSRRSSMRRERGKEWRGVSLIYSKGPGSRISGFTICAIRSLLGT